MWERRGHQRILLQFGGSVDIYYKPRLLDAVGMGTMQVPGKSKAVFRKLERNWQVLMLTQIFL